MGENLKHINVIPVPFRKIFSEFVCFNKVQSQVFDDIFSSDDSLVVSAPTGSGKTVLFELAIVKLLHCSSFQDFKIVYISPLKSLCQERLIDWDKKFSCFGINCICVTGDSDSMEFKELINHNLIISTPEKWDSLTRNWKDNESLVRIVKLFMIDEVHLLNEDDRGSTLEVIVSRMKIVKNSMPMVDNDNNCCNIRFIAVSATIGNVEDVAQWLDCSKFFQFPEEMRPVQLKTIVLGYNSPNTVSSFKFDLSLNYRLQNLIIQYSEGQPTLIFCSTRKSVELTAKHLIQTLKIQISAVQSQNLLNICKDISDVKIKEVVKHGVGIHHAGISMDTRLVIENAFREGHLPILVATSTLAMGVNLPAHLVIIKSTKYYINGSYQDYSATAIHQMIGRAGRPQFDTSATALILTTNESKKKIEKQLNSSEPVESNLHKHLTEHLNAEVVLGTITGLDVAMQWLASTFLYIRARKNPKHYGLPQTCGQDQLDKKLLEMFQIDLNKLMRYGMITMDEKINVNPTSTGRLMARYYVDFDTMKMFTQITGTEVFIQILALISKCQEFSEMRLRVNDKKTLNLLNRNSKKETIRFPLNGKIKTWDMKVNCIIQAILGNMDITDIAIQTESITIMRNSQRIVKCLIEYLSMRKKHCYSALLNSIILGKCLNAKLWENSPFVSKQLTGIGSSYATQLALAGKDTFAKLLNSNPREIEAIIKRKPPFGNYLIDEVKQIPRYSLSLELYSQAIKIRIILENVDDLLEKCTLQPKTVMTLIVGSNLNEVLLYERYETSYMIKNPDLVKYVEFDVDENLDFIEAHFISEEWVGFDCSEKVDFNCIDNNISVNQQKPIEKSSPEKTYIQTFLDIYMNQKKSKNDDNPKTNISNDTDNYITKENNIICDNTENFEKNLEKNKKIVSADTESSISLSLPQNMSDSELKDILEDYKIITAYKNNDNDDKKNLNEKVDDMEEIIYSNNDVQHYEETVGCTDDLQEYEECLTASEINENSNLDTKVEVQNTDNTDININQKELEEIFNSESFDFSDNENASKKPEEEKKELDESVQNEGENKPDNKWDLNSFTFNDKTLFAISQKYLTDVDNKETTIKPSSKKNNFLRHILNVKCKNKKRKTDEVHPADELFDKISREKSETMDFLSKFEKPTKKKLSNENKYSESPYEITEILEPRSSRNSSFNLENQKSIKWRTPLVFSPGIKFSPKNNSKRCNETLGVSSQFENCDDMFEIPSSPASFSKSFTKKVPRTPKRLKRTNSSTKSNNLRNTSFFPLSDKDFESSPETQNFATSPKTPKLKKSKVSDFVSSQLFQTPKSKKSSDYAFKPELSQGNLSLGDFYARFTSKELQKSNEKNKATLFNEDDDDDDDDDDKENIHDNENQENESRFMRKSRSELNNSKISKISNESMDKHDFFNQYQPETILSDSRPPLHNLNESQRDEYIGFNYQDNYLPHSSYELPRDERFIPVGRSYSEFDSERDLNSSFRSVTRNVPKPSLHYSNYVDPVHFDYHPTQGQYLRLCCNHPQNLSQRSMPPYRYVDYTRPIAPSPPRLQPALSQQMYPNYQREMGHAMASRDSCSKPEYLRINQIMPPNNPLSQATHIFPEAPEPNLNCSFISRTSPYSSGFQEQNFNSSASYDLPTSNQYTRYQERYVPENPQYSTVDKDYVINKYWGSLNNQQ